MLHRSVATRKFLDFAFAVSLSSFAIAQPPYGASPEDLPQDVVLPASSTAGRAAAPVEARQEQLLDDSISGLGQLTTCKADFNDDGFLSFEDFDAFVGAFEAGEVSADFNADGFLTFEDFDVFVQAIEAGCASRHQGPLFPGPVYATGSRPRSIAITDLDGDGHPDLVVANESGKSLSVLRSLGNGRFAQKVDFVTGSFPWSVAVGDLDGDGRLDLAVANAGSDNLSVLLNASSGVGDVSFASKVDFATGSIPYSIAIADLNGDSRLDVVAANSGSNSVSILSNTSFGGGDISFASRVECDTGASPCFVAIGDLDGDGRAELAVANYGTSGYGTTVSVLRNTSVNGGAVSFAAKADYAVGRGPIAVGIGDIDRDGNSDLAVVNYKSNSVSVLRSTTSGTGDIAFSAKFDFSAGNGSYFVAIGDLDGDGRPDLSVANSQAASVSVLRNNSSGPGEVAFGVKSDFATGSGPISIAVGRVDDDIRPDLAVVNYYAGTVSILQNASLPGGSISFGSSFPVGPRPVSAAIGDLDGDGRLDLAVANSSGNTLSVLRNVSVVGGDVSFASKSDLATGPSPYAIAIGDLDGDGRPDIAVTSVSSRTIRVFRNASLGVGSIAFVVVDDYLVDSYPRSVAIGDVDGDGKPDLAVANFDRNSVSLLRNTSAGVGDFSFAAKVDVTTGTGPYSVTIGDLDSDGRPDLAVASGGSDSVCILRNVSAGEGDVSFAPRVDYPTGRKPVFVAIGDIDLDGSPDLAVANYAGKTLSVLRNTSASDGTLSFASKVDYVTNSGPNSVAIGDVDGDGHPDLNVANDGGNTVSVLLSSAGGAIGTRLDFVAGWAPSCVLSSDVNGDGRLDLVVPDYNSDTVRILLNQPSNGGL